jgi:hypothetical protein
LERAVTSNRLKRECCRGRSDPAEGIKLKQGDLDFIKATSKTVLSPVFLRQLRKAMSVAKKKKALVVSMTSARSASALEHNSGV